MNVSGFSFIHPTVFALYSVYRWFNFMLCSLFAHVDVICWVEFVSFFSVLFFSFNICYVWAFYDQTKAHMKKSVQIICIVMKDNQFKKYDLMREKCDSKLQDDVLIFLNNL